MGSRSREIPLAQKYPSSSDLSELPFLFPINPWHWTLRCGVWAKSRFAERGCGCQTVEDMAGGDQPVPAAGGARGSAGHCGRSWGCLPGWGNSSLRGEGFTAKAVQLASCYSEGKRGLAWTAEDAAVPQPGQRAHCCRRAGRGVTSEGHRRPHPPQHGCARP